VPCVHPDDDKDTKTTTDPSSCHRANTDFRDVGTPDHWTTRDGRLVRLTGRHPCNAEPPLTTLQQHDFITPTHLQFVRNHGICPQIVWDEHVISIAGSCTPKPFDLSMNELVRMPSKELPVTLVCAGNRRKEQNMVRETAGFNFGPSAAATSVWKGVPLRDLLRKAGISDQDMHGKHVEFIGVEDLPNKVGPGPFQEEKWGKLVKFGTSVPLSRAMNPAYDIIVAYEANGERLLPDHGFPVRIIIPGYVAGRMIKWLRHINVLPHETRNHYHYHDNRILPPQITAEESAKGNWWYDPSYIILELNINSVIASPCHNEMLSIAKNIGKDYTMSGYSYSGGGRMVTRVEISLDQGLHWHLAKIHRKERPNEYGMHWCWVWWTMDVPVSDLLGSREIWCRAWDSGNNTQPENMTWNLMGQGNNSIYRVRVDTNRNHMAQKHGDPSLRFEHPTQPGKLKGGWMTTLAGKPRIAGFGPTIVDGAKS